MSGNWHSSVRTRQEPQSRAWCRFADSASSGANSSVSETRLPFADAALGRGWCHCPGLASDSRVRGLNKPICRVLSTKTMRRRRRWRRKRWSGRVHAADRPGRAHDDWHLGGAAILQEADDKRMCGDPCRAPSSHERGGVEGEINGGWERVRQPAGTIGKPSGKRRLSPRIYTYTYILKADRQTERQRNRQ